jgi:hypothetical protein
MGDVVDFTCKMDIDEEEADRVIDEGNQKGKPNLNAAT